MTYAQELEQYMSHYRDTPCSVEYCDGMRMPFGYYKGQRLKDLPAEWLERFCHCWLNKEAEHNEWFDDNLVLAFAVKFLVNEHQAEEIGERVIKCEWNAKTAYSAGERYQQAEQPEGCY